MEILTGQERDQLLTLMGESSALETFQKIAQLLQQAGLRRFAARIPHPNADADHAAILFHLERLLEEAGFPEQNGPAILGLFLDAMIGSMERGDALRIYADELIHRHGLLGGAPIPQRTIIPEGHLSDYDPLGLAFFEEGLRRAGAVMQIDVPDVRRGTGLLVGKSFVLTCHHLLPTEADVQQAIFRFDFQRNFDGSEKSVIEYRAAAARAIVASGAALPYDYLIVQLAVPEGQLPPGDEKRWGHLHLFDYGPPHVEAHVNIVQHARGNPKTVSFQNNRIKKVDGPYVLYLGATDEGASGSPIFDDHWRIVALHLGMTRDEALDPYTPKIAYNVGLSIKAFLDHVGPDVRQALA